MTIFICITKTTTYITIIFGICPLLVYLTNTISTIFLHMTILKILILDFPLQTDPHSHPILLPFLISLPHLPPIPLLAIIPTNPTTTLINTIILLIIFIKTKPICIFMYKSGSLDRFKYR